MLRTTTPPRPLLTVLGVMALLTALLPGVASAQPASGGALGGDQGRTNSSDDLGPVVPGPEYLVEQDVFDGTDDSRRMISDGAGNLLLQNRTEVGDRTIERLASFDAATGALDWVFDDVSAQCEPVVTADGQIFALYDAGSPGSGVDNFSADPVELDLDGNVVNRHTSPDTDEQPRIQACAGGLSVTDDGVLLVVEADQFAAPDLVGFDTTTAGMPQLFRTATEERVQAADLVLSPDTSIAYVMSTGEDAQDQRVLSVAALDTSTGAIVDTTVVPGTESWFPQSLVHTGELVLALTQAVGGADDPTQIIALDPDTLDEVWTASAAEILDDEGDPRFGPGSVAVTAETVVLRDGSSLFGFDLEDGTLRWETSTSSFSNNESQLVVDAADRVYTSNFGGAPLEVVDGLTGAPIFRSPDVGDYYGDAVTGEAINLGPIIDGTLYLTTTTVEDNSPVLIAVGNGRARLDGSGGDVIDVAIQICQYLFGEDGARTVVLSRDDVFADTLAAAPLASDDSCILFTQGAAGPDGTGDSMPIDPRTLAEIQRVLPDDGVVRIAGGTSAVSPTVATTLTDAGLTVERLAGPGRVETAVEIARTVVAEQDGDADAVVAFAGNWPDAATAGAAAAALGSPVLLSGTETLAPQTAAALAEFGTQRTFIAGGTAVLGDAVAGEVPGAVRVAGANRFGTAADVARQMWTGLAADDAFVFANLEFDQGWALALAASPLSVRVGAPQLGVAATRLPTETGEYLAEVGVTDAGAFVLGDVSIVSDEVVGQIDVSTR